MKTKSFFTRAFPLVVCVLFSFVLVACSNLFESESFDASDESGTAYICVKSAGTTNSNRTIFPTADANKLTNLVLKGTKTSVSNPTGTEIELARADSLEALSSQRIEIETGNWDFTLTATLNGVAFSGSTTARLRAGKTVNLKFQLTPDTSITKGGFSITVFFEGDVHFIFVEVYDQENFYPFFTDDNITIETNDQNKKYIVFEQPISSGLDAGSYKIQIYLQDESHNSLNCYETSVQILPGYISEAVAYVNISSQYSITLNFNGGRWSNSNITTESDVFYCLSKQDNYLPSPVKTDYFFAGWYDNPECTGDPITTIPAGTKGNVNLWAKWVEGFDPEPSEGEAVHVTLPDYKIYVANSASGGESGNTGERGSPLDSIENAVAKIQEIFEAPDNDKESNKQWAIVLLSDLDGAQTVTTNADNYIISNVNADDPGLIICSESADTIRTINGGFSETTRGTTLTLLSRKKIALQDVKITGGYNDYGGGILAQCQYLLLNSGVQVYGNTATEAGGGICIKPSSGMTSVTIQGAIIGGENGEGNVCTAAGNGKGGGVYLSGEGNPYLNLEGGSIKGNKADLGAGVYIEKKDFTMNGGSIVSNSEYSESDSTGGGVAVYGSGRFFMEDGTISSNSSALGAGVYVSYAIFDMSGGLISGNTVARNAGCGAGVYMRTNDSDGKFYMSGNAKVTEDNHVTLRGDKGYINLMGTLMATKPVATFEFDPDEDPDTSYVEGRKLVVDGSKPSLAYDDFAAACSRFAVVPDSTGKKWLVKAMAAPISYGEITVWESYGGLTEKVISADGHLNVSLQKPDPVKSNSLLKFTASTLDGTSIPASDMRLSVYNNSGSLINASYTEIDPPITVTNYIATPSENELQVQLISSFYPENTYTFKLLISYDDETYEKSFNVELGPVDPVVNITVEMLADEVDDAIEAKINESKMAGKIQLKLIGEYNDSSVNLYSLAASHIEIDSSITKELDFSECYGTSVSEVPDSCFVRRGKNCTLTLSTDTTKIGDSAFHTCYSVSLENMSSVTEIGEEAFYENSQSYSDLDLTNVTKIGDNAFGYCYFRNIKVWTNASADISSTAFKAASWDNTGHATRITGSLDVGDSTVDLSPFWTCLGIPAFVVSETNAKYKAFSNGAMLSKKNNDGTYSFYQAKFGGSQNYLYVADFTGSGIVEIAEQQFSGYPYLYKVNLAGVEHLETKAFYNAGQYRSYPDTEFKFTIPNTLKFVAENALNVYTGGSNSATVKFVFEDGADSGWYSLTVSDSVTIGDNTYATADALGLAYYNGEITFDQIPAENKTVITTENLQSKMRYGSVIKVQD